MMLDYDDVDGSSSIWGSLIVSRIEIFPSGRIERANAMTFKIFCQKSRYYESLRT